LEGVVGWGDVCVEFLDDGEGWFVVAVVGAALGLVVDGDGATKGVNPGCAAGATGEGRVVGAADGAAVGDAVGAADGAMLGETEGAADGVVGVLAETTG